MKNCFHWNVLGFFISPFMKQYYKIMGTGKKMQCHILPFDILIDISVNCFAFGWIFPIVSCILFIYLTFFLVL